MSFSVQHLSFHYPTGNDVFTDLSIQIPLEQITLITGANGSGKTTLCRLLMGLERNYNGSIQLQGLTTKDLRVDQIARSVLYLKQEGILNVAAVTAEEDLTIWQRKFRAAETTQMANDREDCLQQNGIFQVRQKPVWELSDGQIQRIGLSALHLFPFHYWILDEPSLGLDSEWRARFQQRLLERTELKRGALIVSHDEAEYKSLAHEHYHLEHGCLKRRK